MQTNFDIARKGYNKEQVNSYINDLLLTIEDYKKIESVAKNRIKSAEIEARNIIAKAEREAEAKITTANAKLNQIHSLISTQRTRLDDFRKDYNKFILKYVNEVNKKDFIELKNAVSYLDTYIGSAVESTNQFNKINLVANNTDSTSSIKVVEPTIEDLNDEVNESLVNNLCSDLQNKKQSSAKSTNDSEQHKKTNLSITLSNSLNNYINFEDENFKDDDFEKHIVSSEQTQIYNFAKNPIPTPTDTTPLSDAIINLTNANTLSSELAQKQRHLKLNQIKSMILELDASKVKQENLA